ncbi:hypothetical protein QCA50_010510 [Cerrena zonata]|uniref:Uncharacterized protein n=1 Tax=Cerrena zonata TaxID=2478898 RepID=A0AAW0FZ65_9APHY
MFAYWEHMTWVAFLRMLDLGSMVNVATLFAILTSCLEAQLKNYCKPSKAAKTISRTITRPPLSSGFLIRSHFRIQLLSSTVTSTPTYTSFYQSFLSLQFDSDSLHFAHPAQSFLPFPQTLFSHLQKTSSLHSPCPSLVLSIPLLLLPRILPSSCLLKCLIPHHTVVMQTLHHHTYCYCRFLDFLTGLHPPVHISLYCKCRRIPSLGFCSPLCFGRYRASPGRVFPTIFISFTFSFVFIFLNDFFGFPRLSHSTKYLTPSRFFCTAPHVFQIERPKNGADRASASMPSLPNSESYGQLDRLNRVTQSL